MTNAGGDLAEERFRALVSASGTRTVIDLPFDPNAAWGARERHYVRGTVNGQTIRGRLESGSGGWWISLGPGWCRDNGVKTGDEVEVVLAPEGPQTDNIAPDIAAALEADPDAKTFFESLATFYRRNYMRWIDEARRPETRAARIAATVALLKAGKRQR